MEDPKSEEAALNEQREASWGVLTSLKTETKSVASRLGRAGQRAGGLAVHHALKKIHRAIKSKEQACMEEPEKQCRSEPITRVASRPGSPDRHTISSSPSDKDDFFQALEMQIQTALWHNQHTLLDRLMEAKRAIQEDTSDLSAEALRQALLSYTRAADTETKDRISSSDDSAAHTPDSHGSSQGGLEATLSNQSTPLMATRTSTIAPRKKSDLNSAATTLPACEPIPQNEEVCPHTRVWARATGHDASSAQSSPTDAAHQPKTPRRGDHGVDAVEHTTSTDDSAPVPRLRIGPTQIASPPSAWKSSRLRSPRRSVNSPRTPRTPREDPFLSPRSVRSSIFEMEDPYAPPSSTHTALWLIAATLFVILAFIADARFRPSIGLNLSHAPVEIFVSSSSHGHKTIAGTSDHAPSPSAHSQPLSTCSATRDLSFAERAIALSPLGAIVEFD